MDHCQNANEPERAGDRLIAVQEPREPSSETAVGSGANEESNEDGAVQELDRWADELRQEHLQNALTALAEQSELSEDDREAIAACSRALVDDVLRCPRRRLRSDGADIGDAAVELFDLDGD